MSQIELGKLAVGVGKIEIDIQRELQIMLNNIINLRIDLETLKIEVANMGGRLLCHDKNCPHCPEIRKALRSAAPTKKKGK